MSNAAAAGAGAGMATASSAGATCGTGLGTGTIMINATIHTAISAPARSDCSLAMPPSREDPVRAIAWRAADSSRPTASNTSRASVKITSPAASIWPERT